MVHGEGASLGLVDPGLCTTAGYVAAAGLLLLFAFTPWIWQWVAGLQCDFVAASCLIIKWFVGCLLPPKHQSLLGECHTHISMQLALAGPQYPVIEIEPSVDN